MKQIIFTLIVLLNISVAFNQSIYNDLIETNINELFQKRDSIQSLFHPVIEKTDSANWQNDKTAEFFINLRLGYFDFAEKLKDIYQIKQFVKNNSIDLPYYFELSKKIALINGNIKYLDPDSFFNKNILKYRCEFLKSNKCKKCIKKFKFKEGDNILVVDNPVMVTHMLGFYKNLNLFIGFNDSFNLKQSYIDFNLDSCDMKLINENNHRVVFIDMTRYSNSLDNIKFDNIILHNIYDNSDPSADTNLDRIVSLMNNNTILFIEKFYTKKEKSYTIHLKPGKKDFENKLKNLGLNIIKMKKTKKYINITDSNHKSIERKFKGKQYELKLNAKQGINI